MKKIIIFIMFLALITKPSFISAQEVQQPPPGFIKTMFDSINKQRNEAGVPGVYLSKGLQGFAEERAVAISKNFPLIGPRDQWLIEIKKLDPTTTIFAENVSYGYVTPDDFMTGITNYDAYRNTILNPDYTKLGIGVAQDGGKIYVTQIFSN